MLSVSERSDGHRRRPWGDIRACAVQLGVVGVMCIMGQETTSALALSEKPMHIKPLPRDDIQQQLSRFVYGVQAVRVPIAVIARETGLTRATLYNVIHGERMDHVTHLRLSWFLGDFNQGKLRIRRVGPEWRVDRLMDVKPLCPMEALYCAGVIAHRGDRCPKYWSECRHHKC